MKAKDSLRLNSVDVLEEMYERQVRAGLIQRQDFPSEAELQKAARKGEQILAARQQLVEAQVEIDAGRAEFQAWQDGERDKTRDTEYAANLESDKRALQDAARVLRSFSPSEAALNVLRRTLGEGNLSVYSIKSAIDSNAAQLYPPSQQELDQWREEDVQRHNEYLRNADPMTLRRLTREAGKVAFQRQQQEQIAQTVEAQKQIDATRGYEPLPEYFRGSILDSTAIKKLQTEDLKYLIRRYGASQVTERLRSEN